MSFYEHPGVCVDISMDTSGAAEIYWLLVDVGLLLELAKAADSERARSP